MTAKLTQSLLWRDRAIHIGIGLLWIVLVGRLVHIHFICRSDFASKAQRQQVSEETIVARPGDIVDRQGRLLATTITMPSLYVVPHQIKDDQRHLLATKLASALDLESEHLEQRLEESAGKQFLWVRRHLSESAVQAVDSLELLPETYGYRDEFRRHYPQGELAAHVVGLRDIDGVGCGGVEQSFDEMLKGEDGVRRFVCDARGNILDVLEEVTEPPQDGRTLVLTIDLIMQLALEQALDEIMVEHTPRTACAIVMDPQSAEVLAMGSRPTFNPNQLEEASATAWKNQAIASVYEPGSTMKPLIVGWGLNKGLLQSSEMIDCEGGAYRMGPRVLHDSHNYHALSLSDILVKSSNIGMAKIGERLGNPQLYDAIITYGFGRKTGIELPGELPGLLRPLQQWDGYSTGSIPMGQEIAATPLQMITAHAVLANGGRKVTPHILRSIEGNAREVKQVVVSEVLERPHAEWVITTPMVEVVQRGTGTKAQLKDYTVFGKTGTAQKIDPDTGRYSHTKTICSFICGAPAARPRLLVLVSVDEPTSSSRYGGTVAAPAAAKILNHCLKILGEPSEQLQLARPLGPGPQ